MNNDIYPCVWFDNNGSEAALFYCDISPNTKIMDDSQMVQMLSINGQNMMFLTAGSMFKPNPSISFLIANEDENENETASLFQKLAADGIVLMPLDNYPFSKKYGWVRDKFGVTWQLYTGDRGNTYQYFVPTLMYVNEQNGKARQAIDFYTNLFPDSHTEGIMEYDGKEDIKGHVQHAQFSINGFTMACMDSSIAHTFNFDEGISLTVLTDDQKETDYYWNAMIADGGAESRCGWLKDRFGVSWQIVPKRLLELMSQNDKDKAKKTMDAMMTMRKIDIEKLEAANV